MTNESYLRGLTDEQLFSVYSERVVECNFSAHSKWNEQIMSELRRRRLVRKAKKFDKNRCISVNVKYGTHEALKMPNR